MTNSIVWTDELIARINGFSRAALSYLGQDGYPITLPVPFTFDATTHRFMLPMPASTHALARSPVPEGAGESSLTLLRFDPQVANERYLLLYGRLVEADGAWYFTPSRIVTPARVVRP